MSATWDSKSVLAALLQGEPPLLLAFDVDGTLAPIAATPDAASIPQEVSAALRDLARTEGVVLALITGRDLPGLQGMITLPEAWQCVEHGKGIHPPQGSAIPANHMPSHSAHAEEHDDGEAAAQAKRLDEYRSWLANWEQARDPVLLEHKGAAVAVHVRALLASEGARAAEILQAAATEAQRRGLHVRRGKGVVEVESEPGDKGSALAEVFERSGAATVLYAGDDYTDLPALAKALALRGQGVFVRSNEGPQANELRFPVANGGALSFANGPEDLHALVLKLHKLIAKPTLL